MKKSNERITLENKIKNAHNTAIAEALNMVEREFGGNIESALADKSFVSRMQNRVKKIWKIYRAGYEELEKLDAKENYLAMFAYVRQLDLIAKHLPWQSKHFCYYPFSGVDFYWSRIFKKVIYEDIAFYEAEKPDEMSDITQNIWWNLETYSIKRRIEIISTLEKLDIIQRPSQMEFMSDNVDVCKDIYRFNNQQSSLLIKGGSDVLGFIEKKFSDQVLDYKALIIGSSVNSIEDMEERFARNGYYKCFYLEGKDFLVPYAMSLKDVYLFLKDS